MKSSPVNNPIQVFSVSDIQSGITSLDLRFAQAVRLAADAPYSLEDPALAPGTPEAIMPRGVTAFAPNVAKVFFKDPQVVEVMRN